MRFVILVIDNGNNLAVANEMAEIDAFNEELTSASQLVMAAGISSDGRATVVDNRSNSQEVSVGSIQTGPDHYTGFWIIEVATAEVALEVAKRGSLACNRRVELRPFL